MQTVRVSADPDATWYVAIALDGGAGGSEGGETRLLGWGGGVETESFLKDIVEEGEGVDGARGRETAGETRVASVNTCRVDNWRAESEKFAAETVL